PLHMGGIVADVDDRPPLQQPLDQLVFRNIRTGDPDAHVEENTGDGAHSVSADPDKMRVPDPVHSPHQPCSLFVISMLRTSETKNSDPVTRIMSPLPASSLRRRSPSAAVGAFLTSISGAMRRTASASCSTGSAREMSARVTITESAKRSEERRVGEEH